MPIDSDITIIKESEENAHTLIKLFKRSPFTPVIKEVFGYWKIEDGLIVRNLIEAIARRRKNLQGLVLRASIVITNNDSLHHLTDKR